MYDAIIFHSLEIKNYILVVKRSLDLYIYIYSHIPRVSYSLFSNNKADHIIIKFLRGLVIIAEVLRERERA